MVYIQQYDPNNKETTGNSMGYCLICAKKLGIKQVTDMLDKFGIDDEQLDMMGDELAGLMENPEMLPMNMEEDDLSDDDDDESETRAPSINLGSIFGNLSNFGHSKNDENEKNEKEKNTSKKKASKGRKHLEMFTLNLTEKAKRGELDAVIGRDRELERTIQILCRRQKNNPCLIGEPGVGKTAIAEALAQRIANGNVPLKLKKSEVCLLDMTAMVAGTQFRGQFENRMKGLIEEVKKLGNIILVIDEVHNIVAAGDAEGGMSAGNIL